ncbi:MAG: hypothetical protein ABJF11_20565 [Reichenbachiella sp.]|uniref:hypothetical protein n=1 Tax=Reichenbachiella sp. TaxID=2184521 RepID=UPI003264A37B
MGVKLITQAAIRMFTVQSFFGREPTSMLAYLMHDHTDVVDVVQISDKDIKLMVTDLTAATDAMHKHIVTTIQQMREESRRRASKGTLPNFVVGDFVLVAKVRQAGKSSKLMSTVRSLESY